MELRWKLRFNNYSRAYNLLKEALENDISKLNQLEQEGVIQRFEYTFELAWKTLKDKMENDGIVLNKISPKSVVIEAYKDKYIDDAQAWIQMIGDRNLMSHTYDFEKFKVMLKSIKIIYLPLLTELYNFFTKEKSKE